ncbi:hypothetical protein [Neobacillus drentensis]|uniref:hypothetical protein n=1 Tax=Neobacillus drentensis TaxID=220684 RepID=UPI003003864C
MNIAYKFNDQILDLKEEVNGDDFEFTLTFFDNNWKKEIEKIREYFNSNTILTDIHIYIHPNNKIQIIVRKDFYNEFLIQLFRQQLVQEIKWI